MDGHIGQQLGNYRLHRLLGQGGFADVYLGEHIHLRTQAAIKVIQMRLVENNIHSFLNEARTIAHLVHPYIIRVLDFGVEGDIPFLVMDYAPKGTFRQRFLQGKPLPPRFLFPYMKQAASALQYAHDQMFIHRDVKPENLLLGPKEEVLLSDFGLALIQTSISSPPLLTAGTGAYMAPEQLHGKPMPASDQYALGIIAYEWITGTCPFQGSFFEMASQHVLVPPPAFRYCGLAISDEIEQVVMTALAKEPSQRFPSVSDFVQALECACLLTNRTSYPDTSVVPPPFDAAGELSLASSFPDHLSGLHEQTRQSGILRGLSQQGQPPLSQGQTQLPSRRATSSLSGPSSPLVQGPVPQPSQQATSSLSGQSLPLVQVPVPQPSRQATSSSSGPSSPLVQGPVPQPSQQATSSSSGPSSPLVQGPVPQPSQQATSSSSGPSSPLVQRPVPQPSRRATSSSSGPSGPRQVSQPKGQTTTPLSGPSGQRQVSQPKGQTPPPLSGPSGQRQVSQPKGQTTTSLSGPSGQRQVSQPKGQTTTPLSGPSGPRQVSQPKGQTTTSLSGLNGKSSLARGLERQNKRTARLSSPFSMQPPSLPVDISPLDINCREQGPVVGRQLSTHSAVEPNLSPAVASTKGNTSTTSSHLNLRVPQVVRRSRLMPSSVSWGLSIFIAVMIVAIIGGATLIRINQTRAPSVTTPEKAATIAQNVIATPTSATITNPYGDHKGLLVLNSVLNQQDPHLLWEEQSGVCEFANNSYHVIAGVKTKKFTICHATTSNYTNFVYEAQMTFVQVSKTRSSGGLVFRASEADQQFYFFEIFSNGYFAFYRCPGEYGAKCPSLSNSTLSGIGALPSFNTALKEPNKIAIVANENEFTIYVNNQLAVGPVTDPVTSQVISQGTIGMMARLRSSDMMIDVAFNNVRIWKL